MFFNFIPVVQKLFIFHLRCPHSERNNSAQLSPLLHSSFLLPLCLADEDLLQITNYLLNMEKYHIYNLGLVMGLAQPKLKTMRDSDTFLDDVIAAWLRKEDNVKKMGEPSWTVLIRALKHPRVMQIGIADNIAKDKGPPQ